MKLREKTENSLEQVLNWSESAIVAGFQLATFSIVAFLLGIIVEIIITSVNDVLSIFLTVLKSSLLAVGIAAVLSIILIASRVTEHIKKLDPHDRVHSVDLVLGLILVGLSLYAMSSGMMGISPFGDENRGVQRLVTLPFIYILLSGLYTTVSGLFLNGTCRIAIQIIHGRDSLYRYLSDLKSILDSLLLLKELRMFRAVNVLRKSNGWSRRAALIHVLDVGLSQLEPTTGDLTIDETHVNETQSSVAIYEVEGRERVNTLISYLSMSIPAVLILLWFANMHWSNPDKRLLITLAGLVVATPGYLTLPALLEDARFRERASGQSVHWRKYIGTIVVAPIVLLIYSHTITDWNTAIGITAITLPTLLSIVYLTYLLNRYQLW